METLVDLLEASAERHRGEVALSIRAGLREDAWTYDRLWRASNSIARHLTEVLGFEPGDRVIIWGPNCPQLVAAYFGAMLGRLVVVPLDPSSTGDFIQRVAQDTEARLVITGFPQAEGQDEGGYTSLFDLPFDADSLPACDRPGGDDTAEIVFTSGTTGYPKGVMLTHRNIMASVLSASQLLPARQYRLLSLLPLSHMLEQTVGLYIPLLFGSTIEYVRGRQPRVLADAMRRHRVNALVLVPQVLELMLHQVESEVKRSGRERQWTVAHRLATHLPLRLRRPLFRQVHRGLGGKLEFVICGGAHLPGDLAQAWERMGVRVIQGYGMTECAPIVACNSFWKRDLESVGPPAPGVRVRVSADGEVLVAGANVTQGYWRNPEATRAAFTSDGWYRTGDLGRQDRNGNLHLEGRLKDLIVLPNGMNVHPEDVEQELRKEVPIAECAVVPVLDTRGRQEVHAVVIPATAAVGRKEVSEAIRDASLRLAPHQRVSAFTLWTQGDFPRTNLGKVKRHEVLATLAASAGGVAASPAGPVLPTAQVDRLASLLAELTGRPGSDITDGADLSLDLGLDSLGRVELAMLLEEKLELTTDDEALAAVGTVAELRELVSQRAGGEGSSRFPIWPLSRAARVCRGLLQGAFLFPLHSIVCRPYSVAGSDRLGGVAPPVLFIANHSSHLDTPSVLRALPGRFRKRTAVAAAADYFYERRGVGDAMSLLLNTFPFSRRGRIRPSLDHCGELVDKGWSLLVFPEGTRSPTGQLQPFRPGLRLLAQALGVPIVPIAIHGTHEALPRGSRWPRRSRVRVCVGEAIPPPASSEEADVGRFEQALASVLKECLDDSAGNDSE